MLLIVVFTVSSWLLTWSGSHAFMVPTPTPNTRHIPRRVSSSLSIASSSSSSVVNIEQGIPRDIATMDEWAMASGVQRVDGFTLVPTADNMDYDKEDVSVQTTQDLAAQTPILFVPQHMILSSATLRQAQIPSVLAAEEVLDRLLKTSAGDAGSEDYKNEFALMVQLLMEYEKGVDSPWYPWLNALPRTFYNGASMTPFCYECLPPLVASLARQERAKCFYFQEALQQVDLFNDDDNNAMTTIKRNKDLTRWAFQIVSTRSLLDENTGIRRLVPMADMFNHGTDVEAFLTYDDEGNCYAYTTQDVPAGSPLRISYGDPTNPSYFFARYGFLDETSPATFCKIFIDKPTSQIIQMGYDPSRMLFYKDTGDVSGEVYDVLLYQILGETDRNAQQALYQAHMSGDVDTKNAIHQHYFDQTLLALQKHVGTFLLQLDELSAKSEGKDYNQHPRLPLILRHNEFVKQTFLTVQQRLNSF